MGEGIPCPNCGDQLESTDDLEKTEISQIETEEDGSFHLFGNDDLFLCKGCKNPLGFRTRNKS